MSAPGDGLPNEHAGVRDTTAPTGVTAQAIEACLRAALAPQSLAVRDDSHLHAGHAGAREGRHFHVQICSAAFAGRPLVARHRLVYDALAPLMRQGIHALQIEAQAPAELPVAKGSA